VGVFTGKLHIKSPHTRILPATYCFCYFNTLIVSKIDALKELKKLIKMDKPKKLTIKEQAKKVLIELKKALREGRTFPEKQGRPMRKGIYLQEVSQERIRRARILKKLADLIKNKPALREYNALMTDRFRKNPRSMESLIKKNIRDLTEFYQRYPRNIEEGLLPQAVLPSELFDKPLRAK
jgi:hypothetical protein